MPDTSPFSIYRATKDAPEYPKLLREIHDPPEALYYNGILKNDLFPIAVVGSRKMTPYGKSAVNKIISGLAGLPVIIISGLAYGVDAEAHLAGLENNIKTIAVLGNALSSPIYPQANQKLALRIIDQGGALISELEADYPTQRMNFPKRNRIISGMSKCVIVVEADAKSGSLITADFAMEQNRDLFAVPGSIFSKYSEGTNGLIAKHAFPISAAGDIITKYTELQKQLPKQKELRLTKLTDEQQKILKLINYEGINKEIIFENSAMNIREFNAALGYLELQGFVQEIHGNSYVRI